MRFVINEQPEVFQEQDNKVIEGLALVYKTPVKRAGLPVLFEENSFDPNAFRKDTVALFGHKDWKPIGRASKGTLKLEETPEGLRYKNVLPNSPLGKNVAEAVGREDVEGSSAEIDTLEDRVETFDGQETRVIERYGVAEVGPHTFPAFDQSEASLQMSEWRENGCCDSEQFGQALGQLIDSWVEEWIRDSDQDLTKGEIDQQLGEAAGISASTVSNIRAGQITCPPLERIDAFAGWFAQRLPGNKQEKMNEMLTAAEADGCSYPEAMAASKRTDASIIKLSRAIITGDRETVRDQLNRLNSEYFSDNVTTQEAKKQIEELIN